MSDEQPQNPSAAQRVGLVELDNVSLPVTQPLEDSAQYQEMRKRLDSSEQVMRDNEARSDLRLEDQLTEILDQLVGRGEIDGLMIGSDDGLLVAQSTAMISGDVLAAISSLFEQTVARAQREGLVKKVEEMTLRGFDGEQVIVRYFPGLPHFFLIAYAAKKCTYRRVTTQALRRCGELLERVVGHPVAQPGRGNA